MESDDFPELKTPLHGKIQELGQQERKDVIFSLVSSQLHKSFIEAVHSVRPVESVTGAWLVYAIANLHTKILKTLVYRPYPSPTNLVF
ncbi:hypothetical protein KQX54_009682 [Cotesia glomerata]|uniref:Uncharacterized protein n=1 Tax=Cotesia glomerata TaxID=32391 RepID=A0AAV7J2W1_COTGL|nr:hypothetical protein KQX54_009682 [Cotesia glomerata]